MTPRTQRAIDILLDAVNNQTLAKGDCVACAVGNLVAAGMGGKITVEYGIYACDVPNHSWVRAFRTESGKQTITPWAFNSRYVLQNVNATEFSIEELMKIEYAFEINTKIQSYSYWRTPSADIFRDQINGLEAVVKVMLEFDQDTESTVEEVFTSKLQAV